MSTIRPRLSPRRSRRPKRRSARRSPSPASSAMRWAKASTRRRKRPDGLTILSSGLQGRFFLPRREPDGRSRGGAHRKEGQSMSKPPHPLFKRVVVKLSGEALMGPDTHGLHAPTLQRIAGDLKAAADLGVQVAVVVGGGNFFRGLQGADKGIERARADSIGMLATVMNALAMEGALEQIDQPARVLSAVAMPSLCQPYSRQAALAHLVKHRVIILAGGTGNPFFTTDTGAALRAAELSCDAVMKATQVDGIYSADPKKDPTATRFDRLSHDEAIARKLQVMDTAAFALARDNGIPIVVFSVDEPGAIPSAILGKGRATYVMP